MKRRLRRLVSESSLRGPTHHLKRPSSSPAIGFPWNSGIMGGGEGPGVGIKEEGLASTKLGLLIELVTTLLQIAPHVFGTTVTFCR
jgi:hypothetical protein